MDLFTIGYEGRSIGDFIKSLLGSGIKIVADVRLNPISRKRRFSKTALAYELESQDIEYVHFKDLGSPKDLREELSATKNFPKFEIEYREHLETKASTLLELRILIQSNRLALMCVERDPGKCHRSIIASRIKELDGNQLHIHAL